MSMQQAIEQFTDRTEPQKAFSQQYLAMTEAANDQPGRVLSYYGMGGIGKSTLLIKLQNNLTTDPDLARHSGKKPLSSNFSDSPELSPGCLCMAPDPEASTFFRRMP